MPAHPLRNILAVSDSLTNEEPTNYLSILGRTLNIPVIAEAHGGWSTTSYFRERLKDQAFAKVPHDADLCLLLLGSNNLFEDAGGSPASIADAVAGIQKIAAHIRVLAPQSRFLLVAPPTVALKNNHLPDPKPQRRIDTHTPQMLAELSRAYRQLASEKKWLFADLFPILTEDDFVDSAHPSPIGNQKIADALLPIIQSA
jgi:lysophospholipase L1-like esterase